MKYVGRRQATGRLSCPELLGDPLILLSNAVAGKETVISVSAVLVQRKLCEITGQSVCTGTSSGWKHRRHLWPWPN